MGMSKREIIKEISDVTNLRTDVVKSVLDAFGDIMLREVILNEKFHLANCFTVSSYERKERRAYNVMKGEYQLQPPTRILRIKLSSKINNWFRWKIRNENNKKYNSNKDNWEQTYIQNKDKVDLKN